MTGGANLEAAALIDEENKRFAAQPVNEAEKQGDEEAEESQNVEKIVSKIQSKLSEGKLDDVRALSQLLQDALPANPQPDRRVCLLRP